MNQISDNPSRLIATRDAIKRGWMILAIWARERRTEFASVRPGANLAKGSFNSDSGSQAIVAKQALLQTRAAGNAKRWIAEINHRLIHCVESGLHEGTV